MHPLTADAKNYFRPQYRLYSGAFVDVVYDHFLALDEKQFEHYGGLMDFSKSVYRLLDTNISLFPEGFLKMYPYMKSRNWLYNYRFIQGIENSFGGLVQRAAYLYECKEAIHIFNEHYAALKNCYEEFFPEVKQYALMKLGSL
jgi:acyl carrier protein phosphodiesterase